MITTVALEDFQLTLIIDTLESYRKDVESGSTVPDQDVNTELHEIDSTLTALRAEEPSLISHGQINIAGPNTGSITFL